MTVSSSTSRVSYNGNGSTTVFAYTFRVFDQDDLTVIIRSANGTETVKTITTHYTVSGVGNTGGGNVTMLTAPASGETLVIIREQDLIQELDIVPNDPFPASSVEDALDKLTFMVQQHEETLGRTIKASRTNTISGSEFTVSAADRANKVFSFDSSGNLSIAQELGTYRGNWAASTVYNQRDIIKDTSNSNIYICLVAHTSTGSQPITSNADVAKWALIVDAAAATSSAAAAASSATDAETAQAAAEAAQALAEAAQAAAETAETNAETAETNAETAQAAAEAAQAAAEAVYDSFDDRYLGAKSSNPTLDNDGNALIDGALFFDTTLNVMKVYDLGTTTWLRTTPTSSDQANINTVSGISSDVTTVSGIAANVTTVAGNSANVTTVAGISANVTTVAGISADVTTVAANVAGVTSFAEKYRVGTDDPATSLDTGDLFYNTSSNLLKVYNGTAWETGVTPGSGFMSGSNNLSDVADAATSRENLGVGSTDNVSFAQVDILAQGDLRLQDTTGGQYVALQAPGTVATSYTLTLPAADGTSGQFLTTDGAGALSFSAPVASNLQEFTASGTWTKPAGATFVMVEVWGAGGGGASGGRGSTVTTGGSGGGGGGGSYSYRTFKASDLSATETVTIGAGGAGGASLSTNALGNSGTSGGTSQFGSLLEAGGGFAGVRGLAQSYGTGGEGGFPALLSSSALQHSSATGFVAALGSVFNSSNPIAGFFGGGAGGGGNTVPGSPSFYGAGGGGRGGRYVSGGTSTNGTAGGGIPSVSGGSAGAGTSSTPGGVGGNGQFRCGGGGGGGGYTASGGAGGAGGIAGGGGGGGEAHLGTTSGAGGNGGNGYCRVYTW